MRPETVFKRLGTLLKATSFTSKEAQKCGVSPAMLSRFVKTGALTRIGHGIYRGPHSKTINDFRWEDLFDAVSITKGGVVCLNSALALYSLTEEIPREHWIAVDHDTRHRSDQSVKVVRMRNMKLGKTTIKLDHVKIPIFNRERTIVDSFRYLSKETAIKALRVAVSKKNEERLNIVKLQKYAKILHVKINPYLLAVTT